MKLISTVEYSTIHMGILSLDLHDSTDKVDDGCTARGREILPRSQITTNYLSSVLTVA